MYKKLNMFIFLFVVLVFSSCGGESSSGFYESLDDVHEKSKIKTAKKNGIKFAKAYYEDGVQNEISFDEYLDKSCSYSKGEKNSEKYKEICIKSGKEEESRSYVN